MSKTSTSIMLSVAFSALCGFAPAYAQTWDTDSAESSGSSWGDPGISVFNSNDFEKAYGQDAHTMGVPDNSGSTLSDFEAAIGVETNTFSAEYSGGTQHDDGYGNTSQVEDSCSQYDDWANFAGGIQHRQGLNTAWGETDPAKIVNQALPFCGVLTPVDYNNNQSVNVDENEYSESFHESEEYAGSGEYNYSNGSTTTNQDKFYNQHNNRTRPGQGSTRTNPLK